MNWAAIQAVAETVGALGVIGSLVYLAVQVRHNTRAIHAAANQDLVTSYNQLLEFAKTRYGAGVYHAVFTGPPPEWTAAEFTSERTLADQALRVFEQAYLQRKAGLLKDEVWHGWEETIRLAANVPAVLRYWSQFRAQLNVDFVEFMEYCQTTYGDAATDFLTQRQALMSLEDSETRHGRGSEREIPE